jgi:hypothetical protein
MLTLIWFISTIPAWWYFTRKFVWAEAKRYHQIKPDGGDYGWCMFLALFAAPVWFILIPGLYIYNSIGRAAGVTSAMDAIFPKPMTRDEKRELKSKKKQEEIIRFRREVNDRERELNMTPTVWSE